MYPPKRWLIYAHLLFVATSLALLVLVIVSDNRLNGSYRLIYVIFEFPIGVILTYALITLCMALSALYSMYQQWYFQLFVYSFIVAVFLMFELSVGISGLVWKPTFVSAVIKTLSDAEYSYIRQRPARDIWDSLQKDFTCCGVNNYTDWYPHFHNVSLPDSCCISNDPGCGYDAVEAGDYYQTSCAMAITQWATNSEIAIGIFFWLTIVLKVVSLYWLKLYLEFIARLRDVTDQDDLVVG